MKKNNFSFAPNIVFCYNHIIRENMKKHILILIPAILAATAANSATTCSRANLTRCLDSACAINVSSNPSARCQYCGTSNAGAPTAGNAMRSISVGTSAKYNISDKELKKAPTDPGERYAWATRECIKRVSGCTADDVSETYDGLIEQSCRAAGVSIQFTQTLDELAKTRSRTSCKNEIQSCIIATDRCTADFRNCDDNAEFDKNFSACGVIATGCDEYLSGIRSDLIDQRDTAIKNTETILTRIVESYQNARATKLNSIKSGCADNSARDGCVKMVCENHMANKCDANNPDERSMALQLCKFYEIACNTIK